MKFYLLAITSLFLGCKSNDRESIQSKEQDTVGNITVTSLKTDSLITQAKWVMYCFNCIGKVMLSGYTGNVVRCTYGELPIAVDTILQKEDTSFNDTTCIQHSLQWRSIFWKVSLCFFLY